MRGYIQQWKEGIWRGQVELPKGPDGKRRRKYVYAHSEKEIQRKVNALIYKIETSDFADAGRLTVSGFLDNWFTTYKPKLAETTQYGYGNYLDKHIKPYFGKRKLKSILPIDIEEFHNHLRRKKYSEKTILQAHRILSRAFKDAIRNNLLTRNPCELVDAPRPKDFEISLPGYNGYFDMVEKAKGTEHYLPILLSGLCGLRRGEIFGLTWNDIDLPNSTLTVRQVVATIKSQIVIKPPKTKLSTRTISLHPIVWDALNAKKGVGYVCTVDGKVTHPGNYSHRFASFLKQNKLKPLRLHDLRHFHATLLLDAGVPLRHAQSRLGHSNISMTAHYQHITQKSDDAIITKMSDYINSQNLHGGINGVIEK